jgi:plastocyanin
MKNLRTTTYLTLAALTAPVLLGACGDDDASSDLDVEAVDYAFEGIPADVAAGTRLHLRNTSDLEVHEAVVFRVASEQATTPLPDLLAVAETDPMALGEFVGVSVALPGEEGQEPEGPVVLDTPGRYVVVCFVPTGADPDMYREALETGNPPDVADGIPHVAQGMVAELTVD